MFNLIKNLFNKNKGEVKTSYINHPKYDGQAYKGTFLINGNVFEGAYIRDGHRTHYTFITDAGLALIPRTVEFKQISRKGGSSYKISKYIEDVKSGNAVPLFNIS